MKTFTVAGLFLVVVVAAVAAKNALPPEYRKLKPYPAPAAWAMDPYYWQAVNKGKFDKLLTSDVSFAGDTFVNFGLAASHQQKGQVLQVAHPNARNAYSEVNRLTLERTGCPPHFTSMFLRKVNQLRQRHQAAPLHLDENLSILADSFYADKRSEERSARQRLATISFMDQSNSSDIDSIRLNVESIVKDLYFESLKTWRNYGKEKVSLEDVLVNQNFLALLNREGKSMGVFCSVNQAGQNNPVTRIDNVVWVNFVFDKFNVNTVTRNVLPPGYFVWDKHVVIEGEKNEQLVDELDQNESGN